MIAQLGLPGEADYAWANERMSRRLERYAEQHPTTRCLSVEWSIWSGVGMGERLGRVEILAAMNIAAISPDDGVRWLSTLLRQPQTPVRTFLSGRFGSPATLKVAPRGLPLGRFLERVREHTPGVELVVDAELSFESDPYLADHVYRGDAIVPGVIGLEAMAQVASGLQGESRPPVLEGVAFLRALTVPKGEKRVVRIAGLVRAPGILELRVRSDETDFQIDHLRASFRSEPSDPRTDTAKPFTAPMRPPETAAPVLDPARDLYGDLFFHSGRFERVLTYQSLSGRGCDVEIARKPERFFGAFQPQQLRLGDPGARDAAIHAIAACVPDRDLLPVAVERIEVGVLEGSGPIRMRARERSRADGEYIYDVALFSQEGVCLERWHGLRLREVSTATARTRWPAGLLAPWLEEIARSHFGDALVRAAVVPGDGREASERGAGIARGAGCRLDHRPDGKPALDDAEVSVSHAQGHTLVAVARVPIACDFEAVEPRAAETWEDLLGQERERLARHISSARGEDFDVSATRVWGAIECLRKLGVQREVPIVAAVTEPSSALVRFDAGDLAVVSVVAEIPGVALPIVITLLAKGADADL